MNTQVMQICWTVDWEEMYWAHTLKAADRRDQPYVRCRKYFAKVKRLARMDVIG